jgi:phosphoglycerate dehydrogenase-like enzyme
VLYIAPMELLDPCYYDFLNAAGDVAVSALFDFDAPVEPQFEGVEVVIEHAGGSATPAMWDAAATAGVKLWQVTATGYDGWDVPSFLRRGIPLANMAGYSAIPVAEHALALLLAVVKQLAASRANLAQGRFGVPLTSEVHAKTLGLVGVGASGQELARRCSAFGMRVIGMDAQVPPRSLQHELGIEVVVGPERLDWLLREADVVSLHLPLTPSTRGLIDRRRLDLLKRGAVLINVARGALVDEDGLAEALADGRLAGAGLDVFSEEPFPVDHPLLALPNVVATPHNGAITFELSRRRAAAMREQIELVARGLPPLHQITAAW